MEFETVDSGAPLEVLPKKRWIWSLVLLFFLELELVEPDVFDRKLYETGGVKLFFCSGVLPNTPLAS